jgi:hypothetical protein
MSYLRNEIGKKINDRADYDIGGFFCYAHDGSIEREHDDS